MKLLFAGDVMLGRLVNDHLKNNPPETPWANTVGILRSADLRFCNLECVISDAGEPWSVTPKAFHFRTDAKNVRSLKAAGFDAVSLANNHVLDYGFDAAASMLETLKKESIAHAGCGRDLDEARRPAVITKGGLKVAFIAFTDNEPVWEAKPGRYGVHYVPIDTEDPRAKGLFALIEKTRASADMVVVSAHWGPNWGYRPAPAHPPFARRLVDSGADIVFGHSCHVFQGVEIYRGRPVIYSAGDFVDDYAVDELERNDESFIFILETEGNMVKRLVLIPTMTIRFQARLAKGYLAEEISIKMKRLCAEFGTRAKLNEGDLSLTIDV